MDRPLRIAIIVGSFPLVSETFILRQITGLLDLGHEVDIYADCAPAAQSPVQAEVTKYGLSQRTTYMEAPPASIPWELSVWPMWGETWLPGAEKPIRNLSRLLSALPTLATNFLSAPRLTLQLLSPSRYRHQAASLSALYRLARLKAVTKPYDVVHAHFGPIGDSYRFVKKLWRSAFVVSFHGYDFSSVVKQSGAHIYNPLFTEADAITVNSDFMRRKLVDYGCPEQKVHKLAYGIDVQRFSELTKKRGRDEPVRILTVGRLVEKKGIEYSIRAFAEVLKHHPTMRYDIVGGGPLRANLEALVREKGVGEAVTLHGAKDGNFIRDLLARTDIFVLASVTAADGDQEGTPVSLLEAQAAGIPVISTYHSGIPEIVQDNVTGFLVSERNAEDLSGRLQFLVERPHEREQMGEAGRVFVAKNFEAILCIQDLLTIYQATAIVTGESRDA